MNPINKNVNRIQPNALIMPTQEFLDDPATFLLNNLTPRRRAVLNQLIYYTLKYKVVDPWQRKLGRISSGITREWTNKTIALLCELRILEKERRSMYQTVYKVSSYFFCPDVRKKLAHLLPALTAFSLALMLCKQRLVADDSKSFTVSKLEFNYLYKSREILVVNTALKMREFMSMEEIRRKTGLNLTTHGVVMLSPFCDDALLYAREYVKTATYIKNTWNCFYSKCIEYHKKNGIEVQWSNYHDLIRRFNIPKDAPLINPSKETESAQSSPIKVTSQSRYKPYVYVPRAPEDVEEKARVLSEWAARPELTDFDRLMGYTDISQRKTPDFLSGKD